MFRSLKFLLQFTWVNLASILGFAAIVTLGVYATGVPDGAENLFRTYFGSFPFMTLIMVFIFAISLCTGNLNVAISFGAKRRDYFWAVQLNMLIYAGTCWLLQAVMSSIPPTFHWSDVDEWSALMSLGTGSSWMYPLILLSMMVLGVLCGLGYGRSKILGTILFSAAMLFFLAAMVLLLLGSKLFSGTWGILPLVLFLVTLAVIVVGEIFIWRTVNSFLVR